MCHDNLKNDQWNRRAFLKGSSLAVFGMALGGIPAFAVRAADEALSKIDTGIFKGRTKTLVLIFQRGAMDGLSALQPIDNPYLNKVRPDLVVGTSGDEKLIPITDKYGLSPYLKPFKSLYDSGQLSIINGVGLPTENRSHFDMQDFLESGTPGIKNTKTGWLDRMLASQNPQKIDSPFRAVSMTPTRPRILYGEQSSISVERLEDLQFNPDIVDEELLNGVGIAYAKEKDARLRNAGQSGLEAVELIRKLDLEKSSNVTYPRSTLGNSLRQISQLIKGRVGLEVAFAESTGWDTHSRQNSQYGGFARNATDLSESISAFWKDLGTYQDDVIVATMTEFGRTVAQNGALGSDHGRGSCQFILGNNIDGGKVHSNLPMINEENTPREVPVQVDIRSTLSSLMKTHLGISGNGIFPGWHQSTMLSLFK